MVVTLFNPDFTGCRSSLRFSNALETAAFLDVPTLRHRSCAATEFAKYDGLPALVISKPTGDEIFFTCLYGCLNGRFLVVSKFELHSSIVVCLLDRINRSSDNTCPILFERVVMDSSKFQVHNGHCNLDPTQQIF